MASRQFNLHISVGKVCSVQKKLQELKSIEPRDGRKTKETEEEKKTFKNLCKVKQNKNFCFLCKIRFQKGRWRVEVSFQSKTPL